MPSPEDESHAMKTAAFDYLEFLCEQRRKIRARISHAVGIIPISKSMDILMTPVDAIRHAVRESLLP